MRLYGLGLVGFEIRLESGSREFEAWGVLYGALISEYGF